METLLKYIWENEMIKLPSVDLYSQFQYFSAKSSVKTLEKPGQFVDEALKLRVPLL